MEISTGTLTRLFNGSTPSVWRSLGYTFNRLWIYAVFFSTVLYEPLPSEARADVINGSYLVSIVCLTIGLGICALGYRGTMKLLDSTVGRFLGPTMAGVGIFVLAQAVFLESAVSATVQTTSAICTGFGSSLVLLDLGRSYSTAAGKACALEILAATSVATASALVLFFLPYPVVIALVVALPYAAVLCVHKAKEVRLGLPTHPSGERLPKPLLARFALCALIVGSVTGLLRDVYSFHGTNAFGFEYGALFALTSCAATAVLAAIVLARRPFTVDTLYKPVILLCIIGSAASPIWEAGTPLPYLLVTLGYTLFEIVAWVALSEIASRFQYTSVQVFGFGRALMLGMGVIAGAFISQLTMASVHNASIIVAFSAISVSLLAFTRLYVVSEREIEQFESNLEGALKADASSEKKEHGERTGSPVGVKPETATPRKIPLLARCGIIGKYYGLSKREIDVFHLLACGRNAARVQEELMISAGTVNTHTRHIYQKLGIHTQQELIDLMQEADLDAMEQELEKRGNAH